MVPYGAAHNRQPQTASNLQPSPRLAHLKRQRARTQPALLRPQPSSRTLSHPFIPTLPLSHLPVMDDDDIMSGTVEMTVNAEASSSSLDGAAQDTAAAAATKVVTPASAAVVREAGSGETDGWEPTAVKAPTSMEAGQAGLPAGPRQSEAEQREERRKKSLALGVDEKKRGKRLFGGLLGTLDAFKKEERKRDASDAAKRRTQIASRIQTKLRSESAISSDLAVKEKEARFGKIDLERMEREISTKSEAYRTRHTTLRRLSGFLFTHPPNAPAASTSTGPASLNKSILELPSPIPIGQAARSVGIPPLFFLPKVLMPEQEEKLAKQKIEVEELISQESKDWVEKRHQLEDSITQTHEKLAALATEVADLKAQKASIGGSPAPSGAGDRRPSLAPSTHSHSNVEEIRVEDQEMGDGEAAGQWGVQGGDGDGEEVEY